MTSLRPHHQPGTGKLSLCSFCAEEKAEAPVTLFPQEDLKETGRYLHCLLRSPETIGHLALGWGFLSPDGNRAVFLTEQKRTERSTAGKRCSAIKGPPGGP